MATRVSLHHQGLLRSFTAIEVRNYIMGIYYCVSGYAIKIELESWRGSFKTIKIMSQHYNVNFIVHVILDGCLYFRKDVQAFLIVSDISNVTKSIPIGYFKNYCNTVLSVPRAMP